ncbi:hypothetical protein HY375_00950 [Candidatus Berkelbacteria bacterium]|nr:hypothetical protein [Candidatus Berkelbacteria bacterium]
MTTGVIEQNGKAAAVVVVAKEEVTAQTESMPALMGWDEARFLREARVIHINPNDRVAADVAKVFALHGAGLRRVRRFVPAQTNGVLEWRGHIEHRAKDGTVPSVYVPVRLVFGDRRDVQGDVDWTISSAGAYGKRCFTTSLRNLTGVSSLRLAGDIADSSRKLLVFVPGTGNGHMSLSNRITNAANHLAAELTSEHVVDTGFLTFPGGLEGDHYHAFSQWVQGGRKIKLVSGICLNADERRGGIVEELSEEIVDTLVRVAQATFGKLPISEWELSTFGPDDVDWLRGVKVETAEGYEGMGNVLLPYQWDQPAEVVRKDLALNFRLTEGVARKLSAVLPFPVTCKQIHEGAEVVDLPGILEFAREKGQMMRVHMEAEGVQPKVFEQIPTEEGRTARLQQEVLLYMLDVERYGHRPERGSSPDEPAVLYVKLEVHGGYWMWGNLFYGPHGQFLPQGILPECVTQHWGPWVLKNRALTEHRRRVKAALSMAGY